MHKTYLYSPLTLQYFTSRYFPSSYIFPFLAEYCEGQGHVRPIKSVETLVTMPVSRRLPQAVL